VLLAFLTTVLNLRLPEKPRIFVASWIKKSIPWTRLFSSIQ